MQLAIDHNCVPNDAEERDDWLTFLTKLKILSSDAR